MTFNNVLVYLGLSLSSFHVPVQGQIGQKFPSIDTENLKEEAIELPSAAAGKFALIGLATTQKAEEELRTWQKPIYNKYIAKTGMMDQMWDVEVYFVPVFTGANRSAKGQVIKKLKEQNERLVAEHLLIYSGSKEPLETLGMDDKKIPYFYLIAPTGEVLWSGSGAFRSKYMDQIETILVDRE